MSFVLYLCSINKKGVPDAKTNRKGMRKQMKKVEEKDMKKLFTKEEFKLAKHLEIDIVPKCRVRNTFWYDLTNEFESKEVAEKAMKKKVLSVRKKLEEYCKEFICQGKWFKNVSIPEALSLIEEEAKQKDLNRRKEERRKEQEQALIELLSDRCGNPLMREIGAGIRLGSNLTLSEVSIGKENKFVIHERTEWVKYTNSKSFPHTNRELSITIKKGWFIKTIGGVVTFLPPKQDRNGVSCDYVCQGRSIADVELVHGFLVKGEHISVAEAKTLAIAKKINADHRADALAALIAKRKRMAKEKAKLTDVMVTFDMSLKSGNCKPGTQSFVNKIEEELGHEVTELSADKVLMYGRKYEVEYYARRAINYAIAHSK